MQDSQKNIHTWKTTPTRLKLGLLLSKIWHPEKVPPK